MSGVFEAFKFTKDEDDIEETLELIIKVRET